MWRIRFRTLVLEPIRSRDMCLVGAFLLSSWTWCQRMRRRHPSNRKLQRSHIAPRFKRLIDQSEAQSRWYWWRQPSAKSWVRDPSHRYISNYTKYCFFCRVQLQLTWLSGVFIVSLFRFEVFYKPRNGCSSHQKPTVQGNVKAILAARTPWFQVLVFYALNQELPLGGRR